MDESRSPSPPPFSPIEYTVEVSMGEEVVEMCPKQICVSSLAMIFSLVPETIWLQKAIGNKIYLPDDDGAFSAVVEERNIFGLAVHGVKKQGEAPMTSNSSTTLSATLNATNDTPPIFKSVLSKKSKSRLKIIRANLRYASNGRPQFESIDVLYVDITEANANVAFLLKLVQEEYGDNYIMLTSEGLTVKDSPATRGK